MSDFIGHSRSGIKSFFWSLIFIIPVLLWRTDGDFLLFLKKIWYIPLCFSATFLAALFPDIDIKSKSQKVIYSLILISMLLLILFQYYGWASGVGFFALLGIIFKHRGFLHTKFAAFVLPLPLLFIPLFFNVRLKNIGIEFYIAAVFGYLSHLFADKTAENINN